MYVCMYICVYVINRWVVMVSLTHTHAYAHKTYKNIETHAYRSIGLQHQNELSMMPLNGNTSSHSP